MQSKSDFGISDRVDRLGPVSCRESSADEFGSAFQIRLMICSLHVIFKAPHYCSHA